MVEVIGLGPTGSIAAIEAVKKGEIVNAYEEHKEAGVPSNCSGLYSYSGLKKIIGRYIDWKRLIINRIDGAIMDFAGEKIRLRRRGVAYVVDRENMDKELAFTAEKEGVKIHYGVRKKELKDNIIIGADGIGSFVARYFSFPKIKKAVRTAKARIRTRNLDIEKNMVYMFNKEEYKGLFAWIIPHNEEYAEVGVGTYYNPYKAFAYFMKELGIEKKPEKVYAIPTELRAKTSEKIGNKKIMLVGNAAGQVKPSTGGGVIIGTQCAAIAGKTLEPIFYELRWRRKFLYDIMLHKTFRRIMDSLNNQSIRLLGRNIKEHRINLILSEYGDMEHISKSLNMNTLRTFGRFALGIMPLIV